MCLWTFPHCERNHTKISDEPNINHDHKHRKQIEKVKQIQRAEGLNKSDVSFGLLALLLSLVVIAAAVAARVV